MTGKAQKQFENGIVADVIDEVQAFSKENNDAEVRRILQKNGTLPASVVSMSQEEFAAVLPIGTRDLKLKKPASISAVLFDGKLILEVSLEEKNKKLLPETKEPFSQWTFLIYLKTLSVQRSSKI
jgi:hypothetical protein